MKILQKICFILLLGTFTNGCVFSSELMKESVDDSPFEMLDVLIPQSRGSVDLKLITDWDGPTAHNVISTMMNDYIVSNCPHFEGTNLEFNLCMDLIYG